MSLHAAHTMHTTRHTEAHGNHRHKTRKRDVFFFIYIQGGQIVFATNELTDRRNACLQKEKKKKKKRDDSLILYTDYHAILNTKIVYTSPASWNYIPRLLKPGRDREGQTTGTKYTQMS